MPKNPNKQVTVTTVVDRPTPPLPTAAGDSSDLDVKIKQQLDTHLVAVKSLETTMRGQFTALDGAVEKVVLSVDSLAKDLDSVKGMLSTNGAALVNIGTHEANSSAELQNLKARGMQQHAILKGLVETTQVRLHELCTCY